MKRHIVLRVIFWVVLFSQSVAWADDSVVLLPKRGGPWKDIQIELAYDRPKTNEGQQKIRDIKRLLAHSFRPMQSTDTGPYLSKCTALLDEWKEENFEGAIFKVECWSAALWVSDDPAFFYTSVDTPEEFLKVVGQWVIKHQERLARPRPKSPSNPSRSNVFT